jgi:uncharacterized protein YndB with AHSA1/START domain
MSTNKAISITVETTVNVPVEKAWEYFTKPEHITKWNFASDDWHSPVAENDLRPGGKFNYRMEARDESFGFDFGGVYNTVEENKLIEYTIGDGRKVKVAFSGNGKTTHVIEVFEAEGTNPIEMQKNGWQAILNNFKKYAENR